VEKSENIMQKIDFYFNLATLCARLKMCGVWGLISCNCFVENHKHSIKKAFTEISHRGPDSSLLKFYDFVGPLDQQPNTTVHLGFHRLSIVDHDVRSNQPIERDNCVLVCNGEIYNYRELNQKHGFENVTKSDCEVIIPLYKKFGLDHFTRELDGEFAFILYDTVKKLVVIGRDPYGVRPLFVGTGFQCQVCNNDQIFNFASEAKGLLTEAINFSPVVPGSLTCINNDYGKVVLRQSLYTAAGTPLDSRPLSTRTFDTPENNKLRINMLLTEAVSKRMMSHDKTQIGCLLSGGLDSSLICAIAATMCGPSIPVFTIGFPGSVDIEAAKLVAKHLNLTNHHIIEMTVESALGAIEEVVRTTETYDVTTIRASIPQFLLAKYIRGASGTGVKAVLSGEGADEIFGGYRYFKACKDPVDFLLETDRLLREIYMFDGLRSDRTLARFGLEVRCPYLDKNLTQYVFNEIDPALKMHSGLAREGTGEATEQIEKSLLREAFAGLKFLPEEILWRSKEAFSDAVSADVSNPDSKSLWKNILQEYIINQPSKISSYFDPDPPTCEAAFYRHLFEKYYPGRAKSLISHYWMPRFVGDGKGASPQWDPSATVLLQK
jgi:asparagine synthase (glutamine-hydrolysing)